MKNETDRAQTPNELISQLQALVGEAETLLSGSPAEHSIEKLSDLRERFASHYAGAKKKVLAGAKSTDATIRENPYASIGIALGVGVLIGVLVGRRTN